MSGSRHLRASATGVSPSPVRLAYNPGLDAFRGLSVIAVVLYHTGVTTGGWIGVECFFVLSGYLITSLLINEYDHTRRIDLIGFWRRRARRLLPALFLLLGSIAVYVRVVAEPSEYGPIRRDVVGALTYTSNWLAIHGGSGYWQHFAAPSPLRHMWSLAVEEQFYLVYPLLAVVLLRSRRARSVAVPAMAIVALAWQLWMTQHATLDRLYLGTDTRAFGILVGATVAVIPRGAGRRVARWIAPIALLGLAAAAATLDGNSGATFRGPFQLTTLAAGLTVFGLRAGSGDPLVSVLARRWLVAVGRWSYGIYLVHWPMVALAARHPGLRSLEVAAVVLPVSIVIAAASYRWIESPIRHGGLARLGRPWIVGTGLAALGAAAVLSSTVGATAPLAASTVARAPIPVAPDALRDGTLPRPDVVGVTPRPQGRPARVLVVGDSVGASLEDPLTQLSTAAGFEVFSRAAPSCSYDRELTTGGTFTEDPSCLDIVHGWASDVDLYRPDAVLFVYGSWSGWEYAGQFRTQCDPVLAQHVTTLYMQAVHDLGSTGAPVYFVAPPYWRLDGGDAATDDAYDCLRGVMAEFVASHPSTTALIDLSHVVCDGRDCDASAGGQTVRADGLHFSGPGALTVAVEIMRHVIAAPVAGWPPVEPIECC